VVADISTTRNSTSWSRNCFRQIQSLDAARDPPLPSSIAGEDCVLHGVFSRGHRRSQRQRQNSQQPFVCWRELPPFTQNNFTVPFSAATSSIYSDACAQSGSGQRFRLQGSAAIGECALVLTANSPPTISNLRELDREAGVVRQSVEIQQKGWT